jgi:hypothetical protein
MSTATGGYRNLAERRLHTLSARRLLARAICDKMGASEEKSEKTLVKLAERALGLR